MEYLRQNKVNLLVYGPDWPYFKQKQKNNITKFWPTDFFLVYYFLLFEEKEIKHNKHIYNQNQEASIVIIINYTFSIFLLCLLCKIIFFKTYLPQVREKGFWTTKQFFSGLWMNFDRLWYLIWSDVCLSHLKHISLGLDLYHWLF